MKKREYDGGAVAAASCDATASDLLSTCADRCTDVEPKLEPQNISVHFKSLTLQENRAAQPQVCGDSLDSHYDKWIKQGSSYIHLQKVADDHPNRSTDISGAANDSGVFCDSTTSTQYRICNELSQSNRTYKVEVCLPHTSAWSDAAINQPQLHGPTVAQRKSDAYEDALFSKSHAAAPEVFGFMSDTALEWAASVGAGEVEDFYRCEEEGERELYERELYGRWYSAVISRRHVRYPRLPDESDDLPPQRNKRTSKKLVSTPTANVSYSKETDSAPSAIENHSGHSAARPDATDNNSNNRRQSLPPPMASRRNARFGKTRKANRRPRPLSIEDHQEQSLNSVRSTNDLSRPRKNRRIESVDMFSREGGGTVSTADFSLHSTDNVGSGSLSYLNVNNALRDIATVAPCSCSEDNILQQIAIARNSGLMIARMPWKCVDEESTSCRSTLPPSQCPSTDVSVNNSREGSLAERCHTLRNHSVASSVVQAMRRKALSRWKTNDSSRSAQSVIMRKGGWDYLRQRLVWDADAGMPSCIAAELRYVAAHARQEPITDPLCWPTSVEQRRTAHRTRTAEFKVPVAFVPCSQTVTQTAYPRSYQHPTATINEVAKVGNDTSVGLHWVKLNNMVTGLVEESDGTANAVVTMGGKSWGLGRSLRFTWTSVDDEDLHGVVDIREGDLIEVEYSTDNGHGTTTEPFRFFSPYTLMTAFDICGNDVVLFTGNPLTLTLDLLCETAPSLFWNVSFLNSYRAPTPHIEHLNLRDSIILHRIGTTPPIDSGISIAMDPTEHQEPPQYSSPHAAEANAFAHDQTNVRRHRRRLASTSSKQSDHYSLKTAIDDKLRLVVGLEQGYIRRRRIHLAKLMKAVANQMRSASAAVCSNSVDYEQTDGGGVRPLAEGTILAEKLGPFLSPQEAALRTRLQSSEWTLRASSNAVRQRSPTNGGAAENVNGDEPYVLMSCQISGLGRHAVVTSSWALPIKVERLRDDTAVEEDEVNKVVFAMQYNRNGRGPTDSSNDFDGSNGSHSSKSCITVDRVVSRLLFKNESDLNSANSSTNDLILCTDERSANVQLAVLCTDELATTLMASSTAKHTTTGTKKGGKGSAGKMFSGGPMEVESYCADQLIGRLKEHLAVHPLELQDRKSEDKQDGSFVDETRLLSKLLGIDAQRQSRQTAANNREGTTAKVRRIGVDGANDRSENHTAPHCVGDEEEVIDFGKLDGTLTSNIAHLEDEGRQALSKFKQTLGLRVVLMTIRPISSGESLKIAKRSEI